MRELTKKMIFLRKILDTRVIVRKHINNFKQLFNIFPFPQKNFYGVETFFQCFDEKEDQLMYKKAEGKGGQNAELKKRGDFF